MCLFSLQCLLTGTRIWTWVVWSNSIVLNQGEVSLKSTICIFSLFLNSISKQFKPPWSNEQRLEPSWWSQQSLSQQTISPIPHSISIADSFWTDLYVVWKRCSKFVFILAYIRGRPLIIFLCLGEIHSSFNFCTAENVLLHKYLRIIYSITMWTWQCRNCS